MNVVVTTWLETVRTKSHFSYSRDQLCCEWREGVGRVLAEEEVRRAEQEDPSPPAERGFFPVRTRSVSRSVTLEGGEMDCNRNNLSVISASRAASLRLLQNFFFFFFGSPPRLPGFQEA